jgi:hypothetical protein
MDVLLCQYVLLNMSCGYVIKNLPNDSSLQSNTKAKIRICHTLAPRPEKREATLCVCAKSGDLLNSVRVYPYCVHRVVLPDMQ